MPNPFTQPITTFGQTVGRQIGKQFGIYQNDRFSHVYVVGQTGTGKSTLLLNMIKQDIQRGEGFCLIDPHGDLAEAIRPMLDDNAIYWNPADPNCEYGYNPLTYVSERYRPLVSSGIIEALKQQWSDAGGVRMEHLLRFALLALLSRPNSSLADIIPMFTKKWFRTLLDEGTPLVANLSKGQLGTDISNVMGALSFQCLPTLPTPDRTCKNIKDVPISFMLMNSIHSRQMPLQGCYQK